MENEVFRFKDFLEDVDEYRERHNISKAILAEIVDVHYNSIYNLWSKQILSLSLACKLSVICDLNLNKYVIDFMEPEMLPEPKPINKTRKPSKTEKARIKAYRRLAVLYDKDFKRMYNEERAKLGLPPVQTVYKG